MGAGEKTRAGKMMSRRKRWGRVVLFLAGGLVVLCVGLAVIITLQNRNLPTQSQIVDRLRQAEKARIEEVFHLRESLGEAVWPGWGEADIPIIVFNKAYAFIIGYPEPPDGWVRVPQMRNLGGPWQAVPGDTFEGQPYYRQPLPDPEVNPEAFTVLVGDRWVASLHTMEYSRVAFFGGFPEELPEPVRPFFPYALVWSFLGGDTEVYLGALEHEAFHAFQGMMSAERMEAAEIAMRLEGQYPWDNQDAEERWQFELDSLAEAVQVESNAEAIDLAGEFLVAREERRSESGLSPEMVDFERQREWLEGLAKYAELVILREAARTPGYEPVLSDDPNFESYSNILRYYNEQLREVRRTSFREGEVRFYYSGMAQALLLDRLSPGWKQEVMEPGVWLEDLLREAVNQSQ